MGWFNTFLATPDVGAFARAHPSHETIVNGARYDTRTAIRSGMGDKSSVLENAPISEEIRRRQTALIARYVVTVRAR